MRFWSTIMLAGAIGSAGCGDGPIGAAQRPLVSAVDVAPDTVLSPADSVSQATALALASDGTLVLLDADRAVIVTRRSDGTVQSFGRSGEGPGELRNPIDVGVWGDTIWIQNLGNARLEFFGMDGAHLGSRSLPPAALSGAGNVARDGRVAAGTMGVRDSSLAVVYPAGSDRVAQRLGTLLSPMVDDWDVTGIQEAGRAGKVPPMFRNFARPVFAPDGIWLVLFAEGEVRYFNSGGRQAASVPLHFPETRRIREEYQVLSRSIGKRESFAMLNYVVDTKAVGDELWLLLNTPENEPSVIVVIGRYGFKRRIVFPKIAGASSMAVDPSGMIYLAIGSEAVVLRTPLPAGVD